MLSRKKKRQAEDIARHNFDTAGGYYAAGRDIQKRKDLAEKWTKEDTFKKQDALSLERGDEVSFEFS